MNKILLILLFALIIFSGCNKDINPGENINADLKSDISADTKSAESSRQNITFIELGSVNCIPCKMMQPVMEQVEEKYKNRIEVIFYDVWTEKDAPMAEKYNINVIPTQIFLDSNDVEFYRHQGFYPLEEIELMLQKNGFE